MKVTYNDYVTQLEIFTDTDAVVVPRKGEKMFVYSEYYKVKGVFYHYEDCRLCFVEIDLKKK